MINKEELRKHVIKAATLEGQKEVVKWLQENGEVIFGSTLSNLTNDEWAGQTTIRFDEGSWVRSVNPPTITLEELKQKDMKTYEVTRKQLQVIYPDVCKDWQAEINKVASVNPLVDVIEVSGELVKRAFEEANGDQKKWLNNVFPDFLPKLVVGKWYNYNNGIFCYQGEEDGLIQAFGLTNCGTWASGNSGSDYHKWKEASEEQVLEALIREAKRRGLVEGVTVDFNCGDNDTRILNGEYTSSPNRTEYFAIGGDILLHFKGNKAGKWSDKIVKPDIDYSRLKTGSKVKIKRTGRGVITTGLDEDSPVQIVFYRTPHFISTDKTFEMEGFHGEYITFYQNSKYILFTSDTIVDYITEVIEY